MQTGSKNEKEQAAASYIIEFYQSVQLMTHEHANYVNTLVFLNNKYGDLKDKRMEDQDDAALKERVQILRHCYIKGYLIISSIRMALKIENNETKELKELYENIKKDFIIKTEDSEKFVTIMNKHLLSDILNNLVKTSQDFLNKMYDDTRTE